MIERIYYIHQLRFQQ